MRFLGQVAALVGWFVLWAAIPAAVLYPIGVWLLYHTQCSVEWVTKAYVIGVSALLLPTGFGVDFLYRRLILPRRNSN